MKQKTLLMPYSEERYGSVTYYDRWFFAESDGEIAGCIRFAKGEYIVMILASTFWLSIGASRDIIEPQYTFISLDKAKAKLDDILVNHLDCRLLSEDEVEKYSVLL